MDIRRPYLLLLINASPCPSSWTADNSRRLYTYVLSMDGDDRNQPKPTQFCSMDGDAQLQTCWLWGLRYSGQKEWRRILCVSCGLGCSRLQPVVLLWCLPQRICVRAGRLKKKKMPRRIELIERSSFFYDEDCRAGALI